MLSYSRDSAQLVNDIRENKHSVAGAINVNVEALEDDLFEQSVQMRRWEGINLSLCREEAKGKMSETFNQSENTLAC